ncbi:MAG: DUF4440 domain-containing protein [Cyanobacteria bacterium SZAS LIN-2]|nr:DUF4440 domain-containing protein [Cyanobacteria bacterium SZAS LIN-2]
MLVADEFREIASTGRIYGADALRAAILKASSAAVQGPPVSLEGFRLERIAPQIALVTYLARSPDRVGTSRATLRSSVWRRVEGRWQILFHQGTPAREPAVPPESVATDSP